MSEFRKHKPFLTLFKKEIKRFLAVGSQTLLAPVVSASLYLVIFGMSLGKRISIVPEFSYAQFVIPGLILMGVINNSFANVSSSLFMSRYLGNIVDLLVTPITALQFIAAYTLAAMFRGLLVGGVIFLVSTFFAALPWVHLPEAIGVLVLGSFLFSQLGILAAIFSKDFDTLSMYTNFLILPLIYLGGLFYPIRLLPSPWREISHLNPLYYLIEGFRAAVLGVGDIPLWSVFLTIGILCFGLFLWVVRIVHTGYRIRS